MIDIFTYILMGLFCLGCLVVLAGFILLFYWCHQEIKLILSWDYETKNNYKK